MLIGKDSARRTCKVPQTMMMSAQRRPTHTRSNRTSLRMISESLRKTKVEPVLRFLVMMQKIYLIITTLSSVITSPSLSSSISMMSLQTMCPPCLHRHHNCRRRGLLRWRCLGLEKHRGTSEGGRSLTPPSVRRSASGPRMSMSLSAFWLRPPSTQLKRLIFSTTSRTSL